MSRAEKLTDQILERIKGKDVKVKREDILRRMKLLIEEFKVPESEAVRTIMNYLVREYGIPREELFDRDSPLVKIADISKVNQWVSLRAKVVQLWDSNSPNVSQVGLIGDETGIVKFVVWAKASQPEVEEGKSYIFRNVVTDSFQGRMQINVTRTSRIEEIDEDIQLPPREIEVVGSMVAIQQNSGLVKRCNECGRVLNKGVCHQHGKVEGYDDLRIKAVIDDGENVYEIILNEENIKELTGIGLDEALKIAHETLDRNAVLAELKNMLLGRYFRVKGLRGGRYLLVKEISVHKPKADDFNEILEALA
ncbi:replication protein A [Geoglobus acetivorans]|uniref:Replication protein A n=1 Tax=Geoglobus acetivorans TaxID=565033 RepID=A0A0A7GGQ5_GEOAI|nr:Replication protein A [Geoglobus acetivorans]